MGQLDELIATAKDYMQTNGHILYSHLPLGSHFLTWAYPGAILIKTDTAALVVAIYDPHPVHGGGQIIRPGMTKTIFYEADCYPVDVDFFVNDKIIARVNHED